MQKLSYWDVVFNMYNPVHTLSGTYICACICGCLCAHACVPCAHVPVCVCVYVCVFVLFMTFLAVVVTSDKLLT